MSGSKVLAFPGRKSPGPLEAKFRIEDDRRLFGCVGSASVLAAPWVAWALTVQIILPPPIQDGGETGRVTEGCELCQPVTVLPPPDYHAKLHPPRIAKHHAKPGEAGHRAPKPKTAHPANEPGWLGQNLVTSRAKRSDLGAYDLLGTSLKHVDLDKIAELPMLKRTSPSRISGRRGAESHEFNLEYAEQGTGCGSDCGPGALPALPMPASPQAHLPAAEGPRIRAIDYAQADNARSSAAILAVIRSHAPGLRHAYNAFLKRMPGLKGKLSLAFSIAPSGEIVELSVASSTTGAPGFDAEIARLVKAWRFDPVKAIGNDHVTVPLTFSE
jgi:TonB family protein